MNGMREDEVLRACGERLMMAAVFYNRQVREYQAGEIRLYDMSCAADELRHVVRSMLHDRYRVRLEYRDPEPGKRAIVREVEKITVTGHRRGITITAKKKEENHEEGSEG